MSVEANKQIVYDFFKAFEAGDAAKASSYLAEGVIWTPMGVKGELPIKGQMDKAGILGLLTGVNAMMKEGLKLTMTDWTLQENRVAVEVESYGEVKENGRVYNNLYHFMIIVEEGQIVRVKEYMDTLHVKEIFLD